MYHFACSFWNLSATPTFNFLSSCTVDRLLQFRNLNSVHNPSPVLSASPFSSIALGPDHYCIFVVPALIFFFLKGCEFFKGLKNYPTKNVKSVNEKTISSLLSISKLRPWILTNFWVKQILLSNLIYLQCSVSRRHTSPSGTIYLPPSRDFPKKSKRITIFSKLFLVRRQAIFNYFSLFIIFSFLINNYRFYRILEELLIHFENFATF